MKRLLPFLFIVFLLGCAPQARPAAEVPSDGVVLAEDGAVRCTIVCPKNAGTQANGLAIQLALQLETIVGDTPNVETESAGKDAVEIVVGPEACFKQAPDAFGEITYGHYLLRAAGNKLLVAAYDKESYAAAALKVNSLLKENYADGTLKIPHGKMDGTVTTVRGYVPPYNCTAMPEYYLQSGYSTTEDCAAQVAYSSRSDADFDAYCAKLGSTGYARVSENSFGKCRYASYSNGRYLVNVSLYGSTGLMNIVSEPEYRKSLWSIGGTKGTNQVLMMQVYQDNVKYTKKHPGGYVVRLSDGRYFIYDTGDSDIPEQMMEYMRSRNTFTDGKVHIALIVVSHPHTDHMDGLPVLASKYASEIVCEAVAFNMTNRTRQTLYALSTLHGRQNTIVNAAAALGAEVYCLRAGQKYNLAGATLEVLFTPDELGTMILTGKNAKGESDTTYDQNNSSNIVRLTVDGQRITFTGDCRGGEAGIFNSLVKPSFESDIMTVAHHGFNVSATLEMYTKAQPSVLFWPVRTDEQDMTRYFDQQLMAAKYVKKHFFEDSLVEINLPYIL